MSDMSDQEIAQTLFDTATRSTRARMKPIRFTKEERALRQHVFLEAYAECGVIKYACKVAGINRATAYYWRDHDKAFAAAFPDAREDASETLEYAAYLQAVEGTQEPVVSAGQVVYHYHPLLDEDGKQRFDKDGKPMMTRGDMVMTRKYSPQLLITLLKANLPEKYRDKASVDFNAQVSGGLDSTNLLTIDPRSLTADQLKMIKELALALKGQEQEKGGETR